MAPPNAHAIIGVAMAPQDTYFDYCQSLDRNAEPLGGVYSASSLAPCYPVDHFGDGTLGVSHEAALNSANRSSRKS